ncbi:MAG: hypothetical protein LBH40_04700 [Alphaproteobacteria bacterium]|jgi:hypothetical protein|nr:hypothetical protein [Alphaproteobacteria bacterium]
MRIFHLLAVSLFNCIAISNYYNIDSKYTPTDDSCLPKSELIVENKKDRIETYLNTNKENLRKKPKYETIN